MRFSKPFLFLLICFVPIVAHGGVDADDLPATSTWYLHIDFEEMRTSEAGRGIYDWLDDEVIEEINEETGIDLYGESDRLTAYSAEAEGFVLVMEGDFSQNTRDQLVELASQAEVFEEREDRGRSYYFLQGEIESDEIEIDGVGDEIYLSFAIDERILVTSGEQQMEALLGNRGRITGSQSHEDALFVLTAERSLIQAGMNPEELVDDEDSQIWRNTKQVALMIADVAGNIAVEAELVTTEPAAAEGLASIVRGLIALAAFDDDMEPEVAEFLRGTRVDVDDNRLKISVAISPEAVAAALEGV